MQLIKKKTTAAARSNNNSIKRVFGTLANAPSETF